MSGINFERLDAAITYAVANPERFDFSTWFERTSCGTTACIAGTVAWQDGWTPIFLDADGEPADQATNYVSAEDVEKDGEQRYTFDLARDLLGLTEEQADEMFVSAGGLRRAIEIRNDWARAAGVPERTWGGAS